MFARSMGNVLRASVASEGPSVAEVAAELSPRDLEGLAEAARFHGIAGYVYRGAVALDLLPNAEHAALKDLRRETVRRHLRAIGDLRFLASVLGRARVPWMVIKGPALATPVHGSAELRSYRDLDVLVPPGRFGAAARALEAAGCRIPLHDWEYLRDGLKGEIDVFMPSGTHLDLHWHLVNEIPTRAPYSIDLDGLFDRRRDIEIGVDRFPTLSHADTTVYVALHAMLSPTQRLIGMKDLQLLIEGASVGYEALLRHSRSWGAELPFSTAVRQMERSVGPVGARLPRPARGGRTWDLTCRAAARLSPLERQDGTASVGRLVTRSVRGDARSSLTQLRRHTWVVCTGGSRSDRRSTAERSGPARSGSAHDDDAERQAYFDAIAQATSGLRSTDRLPGDAGANSGLT